MNPLNDAKAELTPAYVRRLLNDQALRRLSMSGDAMIAKYECGELDDAGDVLDLIVLLALL